MLSFNITKTFVYLLSFVYIVPINRALDPNAKAFLVVSLGFKHYIANQTQRLGRAAL